MPRHWPAAALRGVLYLAFYVSSALLLHGSYVFSQAVVWLPTGVAVAGLWLLGPRWWPLITLGTLLHRVLVGYSFPSLLLGTLGNTLEALTAVTVLDRLGFRQDLRRLKDVAALLAAAALAPVVGASLGRTAYLVNPDHLSFFAGWAGWWRMNALGVVVVTPLALTWASGPWSRPRPRTLIEILGLTSALLALAWFLTRVDPQRDQSTMVLSYLILPVTLYAALRFGVRGAATASTAAIVLLTLGTSYGYGPFVAAPGPGTPAHVRELALQALVFIVVVTPLLFGAAVSEREAAMAGMADERERHEELLDSINHNVNEGLFRNSRERGLVYANTALASMLGHRGPGDLLGQQFPGLMDDPARAAALQQLLASQGFLLNEEVHLLRRDGTRLHALLSCTAVRDSQGELAYCDGAVTDITVRQRLEEQLRQTQKMEALGKLAGGVAHDFNNLLTAIGGYAESLQAALPQGSPAQRDAEEIVRASSRAAGLTRQLLAYSRRQRLDPQVLDLRDVVDQLSGMLRRLIGEDVVLVTRHAEGGARVRVDRGQLEQVILNLALNARDAMPRGGTLTLSTAELEQGAATRLVLAHGATESPSGPQVLLSVTDTGVGMDEPVLSRAFDPFFTTKEPGKGTGLGLSTVYGIVRQSGGHVWLESRPLEGTTVRVCLPRAEQAPAGPGLAPTTRPARDGHGTLLLVEDEPVVRDLLSRALSEAGYTVLVAEDGQHALDVAAGSTRAVELLVTDVVMPRIGGRELAARLSAERPGLRVLYVSGYATELAEGANALEPGSQVLQKPFTPSALLERVRALMATAT